MVGGQSSAALAQVDAAETLAALKGKRVAESDEEDEEPPEPPELEPNSDAEDGTESEEEQQPPQKRKKQVVSHEKRRRAVRQQRKSAPPQKSYSSSESEFSDDDELEQEGNPVEGSEDEAGKETAAGAGAGPSSAPRGAEFHWEDVDSDEEYEFLEPGEFRGVPGVVNLPQLAKLSVLQVFMLLIPLSFWQSVVKQTNLHASLNGAGEGTSRAWTLVTVQEILLWIGLVFAMALHPMQNLAEYWRTGDEGAVSYPDFGRFMALVRFEQIKRFLHLNDNRQRPVEKETRTYRLWHCLPLMNILRDTFKKYYRCGQHC